MSSSRLNFLVIGAQKCATTWLYECLSEHPELHLPSHKREIWYLGGDLYEQRGARWYMDLLADAPAGRLLGDVSVEYMFDPRAAPAVASHASGTRFIVSLRDPIDRAISACYWYLRKNEIGDLSTEEALRRGMEAVQVLDRADGIFAEIIRRGEYGEQLRRYVDLFGHQRILYLLYEDIANDPIGSLRRVYRYLEVDEAFCPGALLSRPKQNAYKAGLVRLQRIAPDSRVVHRVMDLVNQRVARSQRVTRRPELPPHLERRLRAHYAPTLEKVGSLISQSPRENRPPSDFRAVWRTLR